MLVLILKHLNVSRETLGKSERQCSIFSVLEQGWVSAPPHLAESSEVEREQRAQVKSNLILELTPSMLMCKSHTNKKNQSNLSINTPNNHRHVEK